MIHRLVKRFGLHKLLLLANDLLWFALATLLSSQFHFDGRQFIVRDTFPLVNTLVLLVAIFCSVLSFRYYDLYKQKVVRSGRRQIWLLLKNAGITFFVVLVIRFLIKSPVDLLSSRSQLFLFLTCAYGGIAFTRLLLFGRGEGRFFPGRLLRRNILVVGAGEAGCHIAESITLHHKLGYTIVGFVDDNPALLDGRINGYSVLGSTRELEKIAEREAVDEVFVAVRSIDHQNLLRLIERCRRTNCQINILSEHFGAVEKKIGEREFRDLRYVPLYPRVSRWYVRFVKRWLDLAGAAAITLPLFPFFLLLAALIKLTSRGPVFYTTTTVGRNGRAFRFYKFRSMIHNAPQERHVRLVEQFMKENLVGAKLRDDSRVTPIGKFIRKYSIDEFAQLINVFRGEMSLVGPRPSTVYEYEMMEDWHKRRYEITGGMTGLWQVSGRAEVSFVDMIMMDIYYVENCSFWLDLCILFKTIGVVIGAKGGH